MNKGLPLLAGALAALALPLGSSATPAPAFAGVVELWVHAEDEHASWAASGIVLTSAGEVLTTNDVIRGASSITATDADNGRSYRAVVAGYDPQADVALLQLQGASALRTAPIGNSARTSAGEAASAYGNAGLRGKPLAAAHGKLLLPQQDFIEENPDGSDGLRLPALLSDDVPAGASFIGGPLVGADGTVIGINVIGRAERGVQPTGLEGAIPINKARAIAATIAAGKSQGSIHVGPTAILGLRVQPGDLYQGLTTGVTVLSVLPHSPAANAGLGPGDIIESLAGQLVTAPTDLTTVLLTATPGQQVTIVWVGPAGGEHTATIILAAGSPQ